MRSMVALWTSLAAFSCNAAPSDATAFREESQAPDPAAGFVPEYDVPRNPAEIDCDPFIQDCPAGMKCMPWASDGGGAWNATRCSPLAADLRHVGQSCTVEGTGVSGIDDCRRGAMCWDVDPETNQGTCFAVVRGDVREPICVDPFTTPTIAAGQALALCMPRCDPLAQDCAEGQACYPINETFSCAPDVSGRMGDVGDPCEFINVCDPGNVCLDASAWPDCAAAGCCVPLCDTAAPDCPNGTSCQAWYENESDAAPHLGNVGVCRGPG